MNDNKMKPTLNIAHFIGSLHIGGAENQVTLLVNLLSDKGLNCHVIVMSDKEGYKDTLHANVRYYNIGYRTRHAPAALFRLYLYLVKNRIDVLHCHMYHAASKGATIGRFAKVPVIVTSEHGKNTWKKWYHHLIERYLVSAIVDKRIAVSDDIRDIRIKKDGVNENQIAVIPNSVNTKVQLTKQKLCPRVLGSLGRLVDAKNFENLIRAVKKLIEEGNDIELIIAGEGEKRKNLEALIDSLELSSVIKMPGVQVANEFLSSIDIFVMSSKREGVPVALLEAMAHGLPIATTAVGGIPEVIRDNVEGLLSDACDSQALANNITRLLSDFDLRKRLGTSSRKRAVELYSLEKVLNNWLELYISLYYEKRV